MTIIDTHCHLDFPAFDGDRDAVVERARQAGVVGLILIGIDPRSWRSTEQLAQDRRGIWRAAGVHPNSVEGEWNAETCAALRSELKLDGIVAVGETGIDLHRSRETLELQVEAFEAHLDMAASVDLPVVIHQRAAERDVLNIVRASEVRRGVMHCFGGGWSFATECLELGMMLGVGGVATYPSAGDLRETIRRVPRDCVVLETDAPYLAPQRSRGRRNEPALLTEVVETIADCWSTTPSDVERHTTRNAMRLFDLDATALME
jgi:TatD DNase family protein